MDVQYLVDFSGSMAQDSFVYKETVESAVADAFWFEAGELKFIVQFENEWWGIAGGSDGAVRFTPITGIENILLHNKGIPLQKQSFRSYPAIDCLFYYGNQEINDWLEALHWKKDWGFNNNFKDPAGQAYLNWWIDKYPLYSSDQLFAIEKGWAMIWPDDAEPLQYDKNNEFLFCTLHNAEPWYEVYRHKETNQFTCYTRIT